MSVSRPTSLATTAAAGMVMAAPAIHGVEKNKKYRTAPTKSGDYRESLDKTKLATVIVATSRTPHTS